MFEVVERDSYMKMVAYRIRGAFTKDISHVISTNNSSMVTFRPLPETIQAASDM